MTLGMNEGDEVRGQRLVCTFRREGSRALVPQTGGHRATSLIIIGLPARAVAEVPYRRRRE